MIIWRFISKRILLLNQFTKKSVTMTRPRFKLSWMGRTRSAEPSTLPRTGKGGRDCHQDPRMTKSRWTSQSTSTTRRRRPSRICTTASSTKRSWRTSSRSSLRRFSTRSRSSRGRRAAQRQLCSQQAPAAKPLMSSMLAFSKV